ncbi:YodC family protein [Bradyrhizobium cenepequi]
MELKPGDVVMLKSGGHSITVAEVNDDSAECVWMGIDGDLFRETLPIAVLEAANPDDEDEDADEEDEQDEEDDEDEDDRRKGKVA